ncbi:MAG: MazG nucleotide pyrophosphohydrolase domain-containing protein [Gemmatimonadaceae bacterium]|nr:MazG nucleotide pyrophosphohydrolase domain-containing protein [Gemmatimonadaceae bacterium]
MTLNDYAAAASRTINPSLSPADRLLDAAAGLAEEAGEVLGLVRKHRMQGRGLDAGQLREELGDALWCLAVAAQSAGLTLDDVARTNVQKLEARHPNGFTP